MAQQAALEQQCLDGCLRVARQQGAKAGAFQQHHHRRVVDVTFRERCLSVGLIRKDDAQASIRSEREDLSGSSQAEFGARLSMGERQEAGIGRVLVITAGLDHQVNVEALERRHQARHVILVGMGQHQHVQPSLPERQPLTQPA